MPLSEQMRNSLSHHKPDAAQADQIEKLRAWQRGYAEALEDLCPNGRELALAKTYFETSCMWAVKAIVIKAL